MHPPEPTAAYCTHTIRRQHTGRAARPLPLSDPAAPARLPSRQAWRGDKFFDDVFKLVGVPVITVQLRYDGWVTEMQVGIV